MAEAKLNVLITAKDEASKTFEKMNTHLGGLSKQFKLAGIAAIGFGVAIAGALGMAVKAAAEEEAGIVRLDVAMRNMGISYDENRDSLESWIDMMQQKTAVADDEQRSSLASLIRMTGNLAQSQDLLTLAMDMSVGMNEDLSASTSKLMYALGGNWGMIERYIPSLKKAQTEEEKWMLLRQMFAGQAEEYGKTLEGQWKIMMANISDIKEAIGSALMPVVTDLLDKVSSFVLALKNLNPELLRWGVIAVAITAGLFILGGGLLLVIGFLPALSAGFATATAFAAGLGMSLTVLIGLVAALTLGIGLLVAGISMLVMQQMQEQMATKAQTALTETLTKAREDATESIEKQTKATDELTAATERQFAAARKTLDLQREAYATPEAAESARAQMREFESLARVAGRANRPEEAAWYAQQAAMISTRLQLSSYQYGGVIPGRIGEPVPIIAHGGEMFLGVGSSSPIQNNIQVEVYLDGERITDKVEIKLMERVRLQGGR